MFRLDRVTGVIYANASLDRETQEVYILHIKASNDPDFLPLRTNPKRDVDRDPSIARVKISVHDENDNAPKFALSDYYVGKFFSRILLSRIY